MSKPTHPDYVKALNKALERIETNKERTEGHLLDLEVKMAERELARENADSTFIYGRDELSKTEKLLCFHTLPMCIEDACGEPRDAAYALEEIAII